MFRISRYLHALTSDAPRREAAAPSGPVVIWNLVRRCNLTCKHCYATSADKDFPGELSTEQVFAVMDDLRAYGVPVLILSGGKPLMGPDLFAIARRATAMGLYVGLSTNGTLIDRANLPEIAETGFDYVGISLDGLRETHDRFRRREFVTGNNDADGAYLLLWAERSIRHQVPRLHAMLERWGGNASGVNIANIDNEGRVHPDTMRWDYTLGSVKDWPFSAIWEDCSDPLMAGLKLRPRPLTGRCAECAHLGICGGNSRTRAWRTTGDPWAEDPGCYLTDAEIGLLAPAAGRLSAV